MCSIKVLAQKLFELLCRNQSVVDPRVCDLEIGSRSFILKVDIALMRNHKVVQYQSPSLKFKVIMHKPWNHIQQSGPVTLKIRSRSPIFELRLAPDRDYNPV